MDLNQMTIGELKEVASLTKNLGVCKSTSDVKDYGKNIVILQRGWIIIGNLTKKDEEFTLTDGNVIRIWGTTKGLGEIAKEGKKKDTVLDPIPETKFHELTVIAILKCEV